MERARNIAIIEANFDWIDVGTWSSVLGLSKKFDKEPVSSQYVTREKEIRQCVDSKGIKVQLVKNKILSEVLI